ncbi:HPr family phosphocarrier protein [Streptomyces sp. NPDC053560]|uniref:HPr family phosphocarrier protein n=1 Tax=Streptomyces sp. NPDC053560 TaxID=3365711 RepID=UPI0037D2F915
MVTEDAGLHACPAAAFAQAAARAAAEVTFAGADVGAARPVPARSVPARSQHPARRRDRAAGLGRGRRAHPGRPRGRRGPHLTGGSRPFRRCRDDHTVPGGGHIVHNRRARRTRWSLTLPAPLPQGE